MTITTYKWTIERYHQAIAAGLFDNESVELLRGDIIIMPPEGEAHAYYKVRSWGLFTGYSRG